jgi:hypothetical protein
MSKPGAKSVKNWRCLVCGYVHEGEQRRIPVRSAAVGPDQFEEISVVDTGFQSDKAERFIIIGNGGAGTTACEK